MKWKRGALKRWKISFSEKRRWLQVVRKGVVELWKDGKSTEKRRFNLLISISGRKRWRKSTLGPQQGLGERF
jgi:hypothetical protein